MFNLKEYCNKFPELTNTICSIRTGKYPCSEDNPHEYSYSCGNQDKPMCPFIECVNLIM